jgi:hypothetical protein
LPRNYGKRDSIQVTISLSIYDFSGTSLFSALLSFSLLDLMLKYNFLGKEMSGREREIVNENIEVATSFIFISLRESCFINFRSNKFYEWVKESLVLETAKRKIL